jgi:hypothetical protein
MPDITTITHCYNGPSVLGDRRGLKPSDVALPELEVPEGELGGVRSAGDTRIYAYYARIAGWWVISAFVLACAIIVFGVTFPGKLSNRFKESLITLKLTSFFFQAVWLQWWTNANEIHPNENINYWLGVYGGLVAVTVLGCGITDR